MKDPVASSKRILGVQLSAQTCRFQLMKGSKNYYFHFEVF